MARPDLESSAIGKLRLLPVKKKTFASTPIDQSELSLATVGLGIGDSLSGTCDGKKPRL